MHKVDERGKYFTDRVHTHHVEVVVTTLKGEVRGQAHLMPGQRIKDLLNNHDEQFLAMTNVTMTNDNSSTQQVKFIAINKLHIVSMIPLQEEPTEVKHDEYYPY